MLFSAEAASGLLSGVFTTRALRRGGVGGGIAFLDGSSSFGSSADKTRDVFCATACCWGALLPMWLAEAEMVAMPRSACFLSLLSDWFCSKPLSVKTSGSREELRSFCNKISDAVVADRSTLLLKERLTVAQATGGSKHS